jgi:hypothetical protein
MLNRLISYELKNESDVPGVVARWVLALISLLALLDMELLLAYFFSGSLTLMA